MSAGSPLLQFIYFILFLFSVSLLADLSWNGKEGCKEK